MTYPIAAAVEFAAVIGFPVLTADIPAVVAAIHRHYALGLRDAMPHARDLVLGEREACRLAARNAVLQLSAEHRASGDMLDHAISTAIAARGAP